MDRNVHQKKTQKPKKWKMLWVFIISWKCQLFRLTVMIMSLIECIQSNMLKLKNSRRSSRNSVWKIQVFQNKILTMSKIKEKHRYNPELARKNLSNIWKKDGKFVSLDFKYPLCHSLGGADNGCCEYRAMKISPL